MKDEEKNTLMDGVNIHYSHVPSFGGGFVDQTTGSDSYNRSFPFDLNFSAAEIMTEIQRLEKKVLELKAMLKGGETRNEDKITRRKLK